MNQQSPQEIWAQVHAYLETQQLTPQQQAFIQLTHPVAFLPDTAVLSAPNDFTKDVLETRLQPLLLDALHYVLGHHVSLAVSIDPNVGTSVDEDDLADSTYATQEVRPAEPSSPFPATPETPYQWPESAVPQQTQPLPESVPPLNSSQLTPSQSQLTFQNATNVGRTEEFSSRLNPKYTFETFVIGASNRFAHAAAAAVAEQPAKAYNPLFIYGESGLGKTHLLHAIGHYVRSLYAGTRVRYVSSEEFTNEFINSIRDDRAAVFQRQYRDVDVLLVDDIQFLSRKVQTQEEFFHTFNTLHNANKQIVITSDLPPKKLPDFEDRMVSRFEWGLITDVQPPDFETRYAILQKKVNHEQLNVPQDVLSFIAENISTNIRELEGALIRVTAFASLNHRAVDLATAEEVLKDILSHAAGPQITPRIIMTQTATYFNLSMEDLCGSSRSRTLVTARQIAMYLCREYTDLSLPKIGQLFGGRDHTTVMHAERKIRKLLSERIQLYNQVAELTSQIKTQAARSDS